MEAALEAMADFMASYRHGCLALCYDSATMAVPKRAGIHSVSEAAEFALLAFRFTLFLDIIGNAPGYLFGVCGHLIG